MKHKESVKQPHFMYAVCQVSHRRKINYDHFLPLDICLRILACAQIKQELREENLTYPFFLSRDNIMSHHSHLSVRHELQQKKV